MFSPATFEDRNDALQSLPFSSAHPRDYWELLKPRVMALVVFTGGIGMLLAPQAGDCHPFLWFVALLCLAVGAGDYGGHVPSTREALETLPGVGRKTANVVLNVAFNQPVIPVDTHVFRVANRTGLAAGATPLSVEKQLEARVPPAFLHNAHHLLILHGRYVCLARKPLCSSCVLRHLCRYVNK